MRKNGFVSLTAAVLLTSVITSGCVGNVFKGGRWIKIAEKRAVEYVCEKYDWDEDEVDVITVKNYVTKEDSSRNTLNLSATNYVRLEHNGEDFYVEVVSSQDGLDSVRDDYQEDEILEAVKSIVKSESDLAIEEVEVHFGTNSPTYPDLLVHDKYEVSKNADTEEKIAAIETIFNHKYEELREDDDNNYMNLDIYVRVIGKDSDALSKDTEKLAKLFDVKRLNIYEYSFIDMEHLEDVGGALYGYRAADSLAFSYALNASASLNRVPKGDDEFMAEQYNHCEINGIECVVMGCDPEDVEIRVSDFDDEIEDDSDKTYDVISDLYEVLLPRKAKLVVFFDKNDIKYGAGVCRFEKSVFDDENEMNISFEESEIHAKSKYYVVAEDGLKFCFVK